ncbi:MAG: YraN family protein [Actinomycetia bacterium]|nr:YraN family protein [Actinomycetes bacterium]
MRAKDAVGRYGEDVAARHLADAGLTILARNWRCADGELDIVARDGPALVFCEVKTRRSVAFGDPSEAVGAVKAARLRRLALRWLIEQRAVGRSAGADEAVGWAAAGVSGCGAVAAGAGEAGVPAFWSELRFDVVSVLCPARGAAQVSHLRQAF